VSKCAGVKKGWKLNAECRVLKNNLDGAHQMLTPSSLSALSGEWCCVRR